MSTVGLLEARRRILAALQNPGAYYDGKYGLGRIGHTRHLKFRSVFGLPVEIPLTGKTSRRVADSLIWLSWHGVPLAVSSEDHLLWQRFTPAWLVDTTAQHSWEWTIQLPPVPPLGHRPKFFLESVEPTIFTETFLYDTHFVGADLTDWVVVDAGAYVGDTALYYASRGAQVVAVEPDGANYSHMLNNLGLNPVLAARCVPMHGALVGPDRVLGFSPGDSTRGNGRATEDGRQRVRNLHLLDLVTYFGHGRKHRLLKLDVKGEEEAIISDPSIRGFDKLLVEYASPEPNGSPSPDTTLSRMRRVIAAAGFRIDRIYKHNGGHFRLDEHGTIEATRIEGAVA